MIFYQTLLALGLKFTTFWTFSITAIAMDKAMGTSLVKLLPWLCLILWIKWWMNPTSRWSICACTHTLATEQGRATWTEMGHTTGMAWGHLEHNWNGMGTPWYRHWGHLYHGPRAFRHAYVSNSQPLWSTLSNTAQISWHLNHNTIEAAVLACWLKLNRSVFWMWILYCPRHLFTS